MKGRGLRVGEEREAEPGNEPEVTECHPDTRSDGPQVSLADVPTTAKRQGQHDRCRDHHPPPIFHAPSTALSERRPLT
jgi:hypothetical protein